MNNTVNIIFTGLVLLVLSGSIAIAKAPYVELVIVHYSGSKQQCKTDAIKLLKSTDFELTPATNKTMDTVGTHGNLKGVVSCINQANQQMIIVMSGDNYPLIVKKLAEMTALIGSESALVCDTKGYSHENMRTQHEIFSQHANNKTANAFFNSIPEQFCVFNKFYGYEDHDDELTFGILYNVPLHKTLPLLRQYISEDRRITKYVRLASQGKWYADNVGFLQNEYFHIFESNAQAVIRAIMALPTSRRKTATRFLFDNPHPQILKKAEKDKLCRIDAEFCTILNILAAEFNALRTSG